MTRILKMPAAALTASLAMLCSVPAFAANTEKGTAIENRATVNYRAGSVDQTAIERSDTFIVDRKINFSVIEAATVGTTTVIPGQTGQVARFQLTNTSNDTLDFSLAAIQQATATVTAHNVADAFNLTSFAYFVDANGNGIYDPATDTATSIDNLGIDQSRYIFVVGNVPLTATNGQVAGVQLTATALEANGSAITAVGDAVTNGMTTLETVFGDEAKSGVRGSSASRDGIDVATDSFTVSAPVLNVFKTSRITFDGISSSNFKATPGAVVEYCISVANSAGAATATDIIISDVVPANLSYVVSSLRLNATVASPGPNQICTGGGDATEDASDADGGSVDEASETITGSLTNIPGGSASALIFEAVIE